MSDEGLQVAESEQMIKMNKGVFPMAVNADDDDDEDDDDDDDALLKERRDGAMI